MLLKDLLQQEKECFLFFKGGRVGYNGIVDIGQRCGDIAVIDYIYGELWTNSFPVMSAAAFFMTGTGMFNAL